MSDFWKNILRYPRFFFSSLAGLILVIVTPFRNLFQVKKFQVSLVIVLILFVLIFYLILANMLVL